jgi:hypothetical protein
LKRVELLTRDLCHVAIVELAPFLDARMPDVVVWGARIFQRQVRPDADDESGRNAWRYVEAFAVVSLTPSPGLPREEPPPVDRTARVLTDGSPVTKDHRELRPDGQQKGYVVLTPAERAQGFVRPVRRAYRHATCGSVTTMGLALAETYARDPGFYSGTFCCACKGHFPVGAEGEFVWVGTDEKVGT